MTERGDRPERTGTPAPDREGPVHGVRYPNLYVWYVFASSLDVLFTYAMVYKLGGIEINRIANALLMRFEHWGLIGLKYATVVVVVLVCEIIGRRHFRLGRRLAILAVVVAAFPVGYGILMVLSWLHFGGPAPEHQIEP